MSKLASLLDSAEARVALLLIEFHIPESQSLKDKRRVLRSVVERTRKRFNASVAEVGGQDLWQRGVIAVALVANDSAFLDSNCKKLLTLFEQQDELEVLSSELMVT